MPRRLVTATIRLMLALGGLLLALATPVDAWSHGGVDLPQLLGQSEPTHRDTEPHVADPARPDEAPGATTMEHCGCADCSALTCAGDGDTGHAPCDDCPTCDHQVGPSPHPHALAALLPRVDHAPDTGGVVRAPPALAGDGDPDAPFIPPRS